MVLAYRDKKVIQSQKCCSVFKCATSNWFFLEISQIYVISKQSIACVNVAHRLKAALNRLKLQQE
jgi:hypothetical protein